MGKQFLPSRSSDFLIQIKEQRNDNYPDHQVNVSTKKKKLKERFSNQAMLMLRSL